MAEGEAAEEKARSGADVARAVPDRDLVLPSELSGAGQWQSALFSGGDGLAVALVCAACGAVAGLYDVVFYDEHGEIVARSVERAGRAAEACADRQRRSYRALPSVWKNRLETNSDE